MNFFFVSQGKTFKHEHSGAYLWAPIDSVPHHKTMAEVKKGDAIIQYKGNEQISGIVFAIKDCYESVRPDASAFGQWDQNGYRVDVEQFQFISPVNKDSLSSKLIACQPTHLAPLNYKGGVNQGYLFRANIEMIEGILNEAGRIDTSLGQKEIINSIREKLNIMDTNAQDFVENKENVENLKEKEDEVKERYINSLLAKPFVILTGNSGTGKTRIATQFAKSLERTIDQKYTNHLLIPVGADWTDNTKTLGYYNPLANNGHGKYEKSPIIEFIERAGNNSSIPFFLILDEMNLSHVERYFSDFLSKMELVDYKDSDREVCFDISGYGQLKFPKNLFITGTVNIDETTYMFSPKVLDRANVIEFKPKMENVLDNLLDGSDGGEFKNNYFDSPEDFLKKANVVHSGEIPNDVSSILEKIRVILKEFYKVLEGCGFEFAYRTVKEIRLYTIAAWLTAEDTKPTAAEIADIQILQKILPKIHGNRKQIGELLDNLEKLCSENKLVNTLSKIQQMKDHLNRYQYASFI